MKNLREAIGKTVKIYNDPLTEKSLEGEAKLVNFIRSEGDCERWEVEFADDGFKCERLIKVI